MIIYKPVNINKGMLNGVENKIQNLLNKGYITELNSKWNNSIKPVLKPDNSIRLCINMMTLNKIVVSDNHPIPKIDDIIDSMQGNEYFSVIDLKEGYFQIILKESDRYKTAFMVNQKKYEWCRMPMVFKNAPAIFQRIMGNELKQ